MDPFRSQHLGAVHEALGTGAFGPAGVWIPALCTFAAHTVLTYFSAYFLEHTCSRYQLLFPLATKR